MVLTWEGKVFVAADAADMNWKHPDRGDLNITSKKFGFHIYNIYDGNTCNFLQEMPNDWVIKVQWNPSGKVRNVSQKLQIWVHFHAPFFANHVYFTPHDRPPLNTLRRRWNGHHLPGDIFKCIFLNENVWISLKISLKFVPKVLINNIPALVLIMAWRRPGSSHYLNQWWLVYRRIYASPGLNELWKDTILGIITLTLRIADALLSKYTRGLFH